MPGAEGERIARLEQRTDDLQRDVEDLRVEQRADHHRLRGVEDAVKLMLEAQKEARRAEDRQYRRLELRIQWGGLVMAIALLVFAGVQLYVSTHG